MCSVIRWSKKLAKTAFYWSFMIVYTKAENCLSQQNFCLTRELETKLNIDKECIPKANRVIVPIKLKDKVLQMLYSEHMGISNSPFTLGATHGRPAPHHPSGQQLRALQTGIQ